MSNINYHNITAPDMNNGNGLRVVLWLSGCSHHCKGCQNPQTWDHNGGIKFNTEAKEEIFKELENDYINGITFSGGDPLNENNLDDVFDLIEEIKNKYPTKTIWLYSGYEWYDIFYPPGYLYTQYVDVERIKRQQIVKLCDVFVDGKFNEELADVKYHWAGSTNQNVIDVYKSLKQNTIVLWENNI